MSRRGKKGGCVGGKGGCVGGKDGCVGGKDGCVGGKDGCVGGKDACRVSRCTPPPYRFPRPGRFPRSWRLPRAERRYSRRASPRWYRAGAGADRDGQNQCEIHAEEQVGDDRPGERADEEPHGGGKQGDESEAESVAPKPATEVVAEKLGSSPFDSIWYV